MSPKCYDTAIIGGGIVGLATAMALSKHAKVVVLEAENKVAAHQTGNNSGVIHSGLYYKPGSLKAKNCTDGREAMYSFCEKYNISHDRCGKVAVATKKEHIPALEELQRRGTANGLQGLKRIGPEEIKEHEPHTSGIDGLFVPQTGIVDFVQVTEKFAELVQEQDGAIKLNTKFYKLEQDNNELVLVTNQDEIRCRYLINCGGLQSDRIARTCGVKPNLTIIPFRGEYYELRPEAHHLVNNLIYPVPDPRFPFLGVHFTRMIQGGVEAGPNAVLAFKREGYKKSSFSIKDSLQYATYGGFWLMAMKFWKMGMGEFYRSFSKKAFVKALQELIPEITDEDVISAGAGVRAQALEANGALVDDFRIVEAERMIHVLNAPSPAATAAISIGKTIAGIAEKKFGL